MLPFTYLWASVILVKSYSLKIWFIFLHFTFASFSFFRSISAHAFCPVSSFVLLLINSHTYKHTQIPRESRAIYSWIPQELRNGGKIVFWFWTDSDWLFQRLVFVSEPLPYALPSQTSEPRWPPSQKWATRLENTYICRHTHTDTPVRGSVRSFLGQFSGKLFGWTGKKWRDNNEAQDQAMTNSNKCLSHAFLLNLPNAMIIWSMFYMKILFQSLVTF